MCIHRRTSWHTGDRAGWTSRLFRGVLRQSSRRTAGPTRAVGAPPPHGPCRRHTLGLCRPRPPSPRSSRTPSAACAPLRTRPEIALEEISPPAAARAVRVRAVAPWSTRDDDEVANGRLILLHDPAGHEAWDGTLRLVTYVTAELDAEMATDPLLPEVGWSWLTDALDQPRCAHYKAAAGTVTQTLSTRFGDLAGQPPTADIEIRASWTPIDRDFEAHLDGWCALLASTAGLPPPGVVALPPPARARQRR